MNPDFARLQVRANQIVDQQVLIEKSKRQNAERHVAFVSVCRQLDVDPHTLLNNARRRYDEVFHLGR